MTRASRHLATLAAALTLTGMLAACAEDASPAVQHNDADTQFAQMMIVHHEGAIDMADLVADRSTSPEVLALGERIADAQGPEIDLMTGWLETWGEEAPAEMPMEGMDHGGMDMDGTDPDEAMAELEGLEGDAFDDRFLELMIAHHEGAIEMAQDELADGEAPEALELAQAIIDAQEAEITEMEELLAGS